MQQSPNLQQRSKVDLYAGLAYIAGGGLAGAAVGLSTIVPTYQTQILAGSAIAVGLSGLLVRLWKVPSQKTDTSGVDSKP